MNTEIIESTELRKEIAEMISSQPTCMSEYQIDHFVIGEKMTNYRILKQLLMELDTRYVSFDNMKIDKDIADLELEEMEQEFQEAEDGIPKKIMGLNIKKKLIAIAALNKTFENYTFEINILENNVQRMKDTLGDLTQVLNDESGEEIYWVNKFVKEAQIDIMVSGRIGKGVLDAIMSLPERIQEVIVQTAISQSTSSNAYMHAVENKVNESLIDQKIGLSLSNVLGPKPKESVN
jgi:hypothetical protein